MTIAPKLRLYIAWFLLLTIDVAIQVAMKLAGDQLNAFPFGWDWARAAVSSWLVWVSLTGYVATFVLWLAILHSSPLSAAFPATALVYVLVPACGWAFLHESFSIQQALGIALIVAGVIFQREGAGPPVKG